MCIFFFDLHRENLDGFPWWQEATKPKHSPQWVDPPNFFLAPRPWWHWPSSFLAPLPWKPNDSMISKKKTVNDPRFDELSWILTKKIDIAPWSWWWRWIPLNVFSIMSILTSILGDVVTPPRLPTRRIFSSAMAACVDRHSAVFHGGGGSIFGWKKWEFHGIPVKDMAFSAPDPLLFFLLDFAV